MSLPLCLLGPQDTRERKRTLREVAEDSTSITTESSRVVPLLDAPIENNSLERATLDETAKFAPLDARNACPGETQSLSAPLAAQEVSTSSDSSAEIEHSNEAAISQVDGRKHPIYHERSSETESLLSDVLESADRIYNKHLLGMLLNSVFPCAAIMKDHGALQ